MKKIEVWKDIPGFESCFQISNYGRLKSFLRDKFGYIRRLTNKKGGYLSVVLTGNGIKNKSTRMHRLVAENFIPNPDNKREVNHKDCNKQNNHVDNLEWATSRENVLHAVENIPSILNGIHKHNKILKPKTILQYSLDGDLLGVFTNAKEAGRQTGVCSRNILQVADKTEYKPGLTRKQAGGFVWKFKKGTGGKVDTNISTCQRKQG